MMIFDSERLFWVWGCGTERCLVLAVSEICRLDYRAQPHGEAIEAEPECCLGN